MGEGGAKKGTSRYLKTIFEYQALTVFAPLNSIDVSGRVSHIKPSIYNRTGTRKVRETEEPGYWIRGK